MKFSTTISTLLLGALVSACDPLTSTSCDPDPALAASFKETFLSKSEYFNEENSEGLSYSEDGLKFELAKRLDNPSIKSNFYIMFGKVEVVMQAAAGTGIVSSFYLQSDDLDEIDIEMVGGDTMNFQSNFFSKGDTTTYTRGEYHTASSSVVSEFHTYTIEMTEDEVTWSLDGTVVRTLLPDNGQGFPQSPMYIMAGVWAGGDSSNAAGTIEWAGGAVDYSQAPFDMYIKSLIVSDYSTGKEYEYSDTSGDWSSIVAVDGKVNGRKTQAQSEFAALQDGGSVSNSYSADTSQTGTTSSSTSSESVSTTSSITSTALLESKSELISTTSSVSSGETDESTTEVSTSVTTLTTNTAQATLESVSTSTLLSSFTFFEGTTTTSNIHPQIASSAKVTSTASGQVVTESLLTLVTKATGTASASSSYATISSANVAVGKRSGLFMLALGLLASLS